MLSVPAQPKVIEERCITLRQIRRPRPARVRSRKKQRRADFRLPKSLALGYFESGAHSMHLIPYARRITHYGFLPFAWLPAVLCRLEAGQEPTKKKKGHMTKKTMIAGAAIAGLMSGSFAVPRMPPIQLKAGVSLKMGDKESRAKDKHACKGQNSCKGKGGCKTGDNGCKGKNSCKGKGGCATDGSHPAEPRKLSSESFAHVYASAGEPGAPSLRVLHRSLFELDAGKSLQ